MTPEEIEELADQLAARLRMAVHAEVPPEIRSLIAHNATNRFPVYGWADAAGQPYVVMDVSQQQIRVELRMAWGDPVAAVAFTFTGGLDPRLRAALRERGYG